MTLRIPMLPDQEPRKAAIVKLDVSLMAELMCLPEGIEADCASFSVENGILSIRLSGEGLPDDCMLSQPGSRLIELRPCLRKVKARTFEDEPRDLWATEFERFE